MSPSVAAALEAIHKAVASLQDAVADTEPAPITVVLVQSADGGKVHRAARIEGIPGLMTYEADNLDWTDYKIIRDLSKVSDDLALCGRCFGPLDAGAEGDV